MKESYYFSHDSNARNDEKILMLRAAHGLEGYGAFWVLIEMMFENAETALSHSKTKGLAVNYNIDITVLESVINTCITENLFASDGEFFWSESLRRRKKKYQDLKEKKSEAGKKGMATRWTEQGIDNTVITGDNSSNNTDITKDNKGKESKGNENKYLYILQSEEIWSKYPNKKGRSDAMKKLPKLIEEYGYEQIARTIERYKQYVEQKRKESFKDLQYKNGSTFFNSGYVDYLDDNYEVEPDKKTTKLALLDKYLGGE